MDRSVDLEEIEGFLKLQTKEVQEDCRIVDTDALGQDFLLRIDKKPPPKFIPNMPKSAMPSENTSTPRITTAPTLVGCMIGYFRIERDVIDGTAPDVNGNTKFAGGYSISKLKIKHCLKPGKTMVVDADSSDEHWIVPYSMDSVEYVPEIIGQVFVGAVTYLPVSNHWPGVRLEMYLRIDSDDTIQLVPGRRVGKGFYRYTVYWPNVRTRTVQDPNCLIGLEPIEQVVYDEQKKLKANLLSFTDKLPGFSGW